MEISKTFLGTLPGNISLIGKFLSHLTFKIWFQPIQRIFHGKNGPNLPDFRENKFQISRFWCLVQVGSQEYRRIFFLLSYLEYSQIWLNYFCQWLPLWLHHKILKTNPAARYSSQDYFQPSQALQSLVSIQSTISNTIFK